MDPYLVFRRARALGAAAAILMLVLVLAPGARPASAPPLVELQSVTIANGAATISGTLGPTAAGAEVTVNGHPLSLDSSGHFAGVVQLGGASSLDLGVANSVSGEHTHFTIPLTDSLAGVGAIPGDVLSAVQHAGASLVQPAGGFSIVDGKPLVIGGGVADGSGLAGLTVNGVDALALLKPDQSFTLTLPGTTKAITLTTTDTGGISETRSYSVLQHSTLLRTSKGISVAASGALGVRIAQVRYLTKGVVQTHRLRMLVTIKDRRGYLVRGAVVSIRSTRGNLLLRRVQTKKSSRVGEASYVLAVRRAAFGKRLVIDTTAKTPTARALRRTSVRLARIKARRS